MIEAFENRRGPDRRRMPRGGRRAGDAPGFAPLVLVVGRGETAVTQSEAVLARLKFAVTTSGTVEEALRVLSGIRPDVVVAEPEAASRIRLEAPEHAQGRQPARGKCANAHRGTIPGQNRQGRSGRA